MMVDGIPAAMIKAKWIKLRTEYHLHIAKGLDMFLVVAIILALDDKAKTKHSAAGAGAAGAS